MLTIIVFVVILVVGLLFALFNKNNRYNWLCVSFIAGLVLIPMSLSLINIGNRFNYIIEKYDNLKLQVETYNKMEDPTKIASFGYDIRKEVLRMNNQISKHKVMSNSVWVSCWYSKKVGNLEKLKLNQIE